jgi:hypothetical protein
MATPALKNSKHFSLVYDDSFVNQTHVDLTLSLLEEAYNQYFDAWRFNKPKVWLDDPNFKLQVFFVSSQPYAGSYRPGWGPIKPSINLSYPTIFNDPNTFNRHATGVIYHELFHAIQDGAYIDFTDYTVIHPNSTWIFESTADAMGDEGLIISGHEPEYTQPLNSEDKDDSYQRELLNRLKYKSIFDEENSYMASVLFSYVMHRFRGVEHIKNILELTGQNLLLNKIESVQQMAENVMDFTELYHHLIISLVTGSQSTHESRFRGPKVIPIDIQKFSLDQDFDFQRGPPSYYLKLEPDEKKVLPKSIDLNAFSINILELHSFCRHLDIGKSMPIVISLFDKTNPNIKSSLIYTKGAPSLMNTYEVYDPDQNNVIHLNSFKCRNDTLLLVSNNPTTAPSVSFQLSGISGQHPYVKRVVVRNVVNENLIYDGTWIDDPQNRLQRVWVQNAVIPQALVYPMGDPLKMAVDIFMKNDLDRINSTLDPSSFGVFEIPHQDPNYHTSRKKSGDLRHTKTEDNLAHYAVISDDNAQAYLEFTPDIKTTHLKFKIRGLMLDGNPETVPTLRRDQVVNLEEVESYSASMLRGDDKNYTLPITLMPKDVATGDLRYCVGQRDGLYLEFTIKDDPIKPGERMTIRMKALMPNGQWVNVQEQCSRGDSVPTKDLGSDVYYCAPWMNTLRAAKQVKDITLKISGTMPGTTRIYASDLQITLPTYDLDANDDGIDEKEMPHCYYDSNDAARDGFWIAPWHSAHLNFRIQP